MESQESTPRPPSSPDGSRSNDTSEGSTDARSPEFEPSLGYNGTSGHQAAESSADATRHADTTGITNKAQRYALILATQNGAKGVTVAELRELHGSLHHGRISAALTNLHKAGRLAALKDRRRHCGIYVLPEFVEGREVRQFRSNRPQIDREELKNLMHDHAVLISMAPGRPNHCKCGRWSWTPSKDFLDHMADEIIAGFGR
jgi:hypothetical protein